MTYLFLLVFISDIKCIIQLKQIKNKRVRRLKIEVFCLILWLKLIWLFQLILNKTKTYCAHKLRYIFVHTKTNIPALCAKTTLNQEILKVKLFYNQKSIKVGILVYFCHNFCPPVKQFNAIKMFEIFFLNGKLFLEVSSGYVWLKYLIFNNLTTL